MKIYGKILLVVGCAGALAAQGVVFYSRKAVHAALLLQLEQAAIRDVAERTPKLLQGLRASDERMLLSELQVWLRQNGGAYAVALDFSGRVMGHTNVAELGKTYADAFTRAALASETPLSREVGVKGGRQLEVNVPVFSMPTQEGDELFLLGEAGDAKKGARIATLRIGLPLDAVLKTERRIVGQIVWIVLTMGGVGSLLLFVSIRRIVAPIRLMADATAKIRAGDFEVGIPVTSQDELGSLARNFNEMTRTLARTTVSKNYFNDILDSIQDLVVVTDAAGAVTLVNPAVVKLLGFSKDELLGRPAASLFDGAAVSFAAPVLNGAAQMLGKSGLKTPVLYSTAALKTADGGIAGYIGVAKDVSDVKKLEARMHQSEKLSAVGQLAAGVAHEINNPLGVILGFAQGMALRLKAGDELELPIKSIEREALRCKALVQNLLTFARTSHSDRAAMDVNSAVEQSLALIAPQAKIARVRVATALAEGLPPVLGNKNQLEQVIMNLAKNAIDAMPNGGTLTITSELAEQAPHSWVTLRFCDDGTGIPPALLTKIFDPFFTTKPIGQGTGLGLSLVSEIVQKHSGEISVESRPGRTAFTVKLPARTGHEMEQRLRSLKQEKSAAESVASRTKGKISHG